MGALRILIALVAAGAPALARLEATARDALAAGLDPQACYRIRDLHFSREDLRFYFTDGYLIFGKPVRGRRITAVFSAETEGGAGEVVLFPPSVAERRSL
ncbi:MAG: hypothetical protein ACP5U2_03200, partial [Bryobacteraceae bacterium]